MFFRRVLSKPRKKQRTLLNVEVLESRDAPTAAPGNDLLWKAYPSANAFKLHSNPGANQVIYLDFDGETVAGTQWNTDANGGSPFTVSPWSMDGNRNAFSTAEQDKIIELWRMIAEDFAPFNVNVTTENPGLEALRKVNAADTKWGMHVILGPVPSVSDSNFFSGAGGIAYLNSFNDAVDTPCFAFNGDSSATPEDSLPVTVSHEVGHTFGLDHDGTSSQGYYGGHGSGNVSWGPIMGAPFSINLTQWSRDTYPDANNPEDDLTKITTGHGFGYRKDDVGNTAASGKVINGASQAALNPTYGLIEKNTDSDFYKFYADPGSINIKIDSLFVGPNLDILATLYGPNGAVVATSNPLAETFASFSLNLTQKGAYTIKITGTGLAGATGYPKYGSLGSYRITGTVTPYTPEGASFRSLNPVRWSYSPSSGIFSGYITVANITKISFSGSFTFEITLPSSSIQVITPNGVQKGNKLTLTYTGTLLPNKPLRIYLQLVNPLRLALGTGIHSWVTKITANS